MFPLQATEAESTTSLTGYEMVKLRGSIENVLFSRVSSISLFEVQLSDTGFSFGLGALDHKRDTALKGLGELISTPEAVGVLPGQGKLLVAMGGDDRRLYTPFNVMLTGIETIPLSRIVPQDDSSRISAIDIWRTLIPSLCDSGQHGPFYGAVWFARISSFRGAFVRKPPVVENAPPDGRPINDPEWHSEWFDVNPDGGLAEKGALIVGIAFDPNSPYVTNLEGEDRHIFYRHPDAPREGRGLVVHQHALIFDKFIEPLPGESVAVTSSMWLEESRVLDVKHVLEDSRFDIVYGGVVSYSEVARI